MMIAIPLGYFVAIFLVISGLLSGVEFLGNRPTDCTRAVLLKGLAEAAWPIIAGSVILLLIQINKQLESLRLAARYEPPTKDTKKKKKKLIVEEEEEEEKKQPTCFTPTFVPDAAPQQPAAQPKPEPPAPAPLPLTAPPMRPVVPVASITPSSVPPSSKSPLYPNSPIPGGGRVPQPPPPMPPQADGVANLPTGGKRAPRKGENQGLSFFKVD